MGRLRIILGLLLIAFSADAQQLQGSNWVFGIGAWVNFLSSPPTNQQGASINTSNKAASISDKNGKLLLYSDGQYLRNSKYETVFTETEGCQLNRSPVSRCLIVESVTNPNYIGYVNGCSSDYGYTLNVLKKTSDTTFRLVSRQTLNNSGSTLLSCLYSKEDSTFRIIITGYNNNYNIVTVNFKDSIFSNFNTIGNSSLNIRGFDIKASPKSKFLVLPLAEPNNQKALIYRLSNNGNLIDSSSFSHPSRSIYSFSFSASEKYLYVTWQKLTNDTNTMWLYRYDMTLYPNLRAEFVTQYSPGRREAPFSFLQLGSTGEIYAGSLLGNSFSRIRYPDQDNVANIGLDPNFMTLLGIFGNTFPALNQTLFRNADKLQATPSKDTVCAGDSVTLFAYGASMNTFRWRSNPTLVIAEVANPKVLVNSSTTFFVTGSNPYETRDTSVRVVAVPPPPTPDLGPDVVFCNLQQPFLVSRNILPTNLRYRWSTGATTVNIVPIDTGWYWLEVSNGYCSRRDSVRVLGFETPPQAVANSPNTILCNESSTAIAANNPNNNPLNRWRIIEGSGTIENINSAETRIGNLPFGITKLVWEVSASRAVNCFSSDTLTIERRRLPVSNIIGRRSICPGLPVSVYRADTNLIRSGSIVWNVKKGRVLSIENNNSLIRIQWQNEITDSAEVNLFAFGKNDCPMADTLRFRVRVSPNLLPEPVLSTDTIFCFSDSSSVFSIADPQPSATYQWQVKNAEIVGSSTSNSVQISWRNFKKINLLNPDSLPQVWYSERIETPITVCNGVSDTFRIKYQAAPTLAWKTDTFTCSNTAILIPTAANTPDSDSLLIGTTFIWQPNTYLDNPIGLQTSFLFPQSQFRNGQSDTTLQYIRTTRTGKGCLFVDTVNIKVFSRPQTIEFSLDSALCLNDAQEINITNFNDSLNYFFAISSDTSAMNNLVFNPFNSSDTLLPQNSVGRFKIAIFNLNRNGCSSDTTIKFYTINPLPNPDLSVNNKYICPNFLSNIPYRVQGKAGSSFSWSVSGGRVLSDTGNQVLVNWDNVELRSLQVTETDTNGCITQSDPFDVLLDKNVDIPESGCKLSDYPLIGGNVLTLNGDGINEQITFRNINFYGNCKLIIFNRYGTPILTIPNYQTSNNYSPTNLADGMYYYQLQSARAVVKGWLVVVR